MGFYYGETNGLRYYEMERGPWERRYEEAKKCSLIGLEVNIGGCLNKHTKIDFEDEVTCGLDKNKLVILGIKW